MYKWPQTKWPEIKEMHSLVALEARHSKLVHQQATLLLKVSCPFVLSGGSRPVMANFLELSTITNTPLQRACQRFATTTQAISRPAVISVSLLLSSPFLSIILYWSGTHMDTTERSLRALIAFANPPPPFFFSNNVSHKFQHLGYGRMFWETSNPLNHPTRGQVVGATLPQPASVFLVNGKTPCPLLLYITEFPQ